MGCTNTKPKIEVPVTVQEPEKEITLEELEMKKEEFFIAIEGICELNDFVGATAAYQNICDLEIQVNKCETEFAYECYSNLFPLYMKCTSNNVRIKLYLKTLLWFYTWRNYQRPGHYSGSLGRICREYAKILYQEKRYIEAFFYINLAFAFGDAGGDTIRENVTLAIIDTDKKLLGIVQGNLNEITEILKRENNVETEEIAEIYLKIAQSLSQNEKVKESIAFFKRARDLYYLSYFEKSANRERIGDIYFELAKIARDNNKLGKAQIYFELSIVWGSKEKAQQTQEFLNKMLAKAPVNTNNLQNNQVRLQESINKITSSNTAIFYYYMELTMQLLEENKFEEALVYLKKCSKFTSYKSFNDSSFAGIFKLNLTMLGKAYLAKFKLLAAEYYLERILPLGDQKNQNEIAGLLKRIYSTLKAQNTVYIIPQSVRDIFLRGHINRKQGFDSYMVTLENNPIILENRV